MRGEAYSFMTNAPVRPVVRRLPGVVPRYALFASPGAVAIVGRDASVALPGAAAADSRVAHCTSDIP